MNFFIAGVSTRPLRCRMASGRVNSFPLKLIAASVPCFTSWTTVACGTIATPWSSSKARYTVSMLSNSMTGVISSL